MAQTLSESVLGRLIQNPKLLNHVKFEKNLFESERERRTLTATEKMYQESGSVDIIRLAEKIGGEHPASYLTSLTDGLHKVPAKTFVLHVTELKKKKIENELFKEFEKQRNFFLKGMSTDLEKVRCIFSRLDELGNAKESEEASIVSLKDIDPEKVEWLWSNRIPLGKLTLIVGDPGDGKSYLILFIASRISTGIPWPDGLESITKGSTILLTAEDGLSDTVRIRMDAMKADVNKIHILQGIKTKKEDDLDLFSVMRHIPILERTIHQLGDVRLVILDPITAYLGQTEDNQNTSVRSALAPLAALAEREKVAIVAISHLNKDVAKRAVYRAMGSVAFVAAARAVWAISRDDENNSRRFLTPLKTNLSVDPTSLAFSITDLGVVFEPDPVNITSDEAFADRETKEQYSALEDARKWLAECLKDKPLSSNEIKRQAEDNGINFRTIRRAKEKMNIEVYQKDGHWKWELRKI